MVPSTTARIDLETFSSLDNLSTDPEFLVTLVAGFLRDSEEQLRLAREALGSGRLSCVHDALHAMQGTSGSIGAVGMMRTCSDIRGRSNDQLEHEGAALIEDLAAQLEESRILLGQYLGDRVRPNR
ncbi:MAG: Hpt domain-containing protein [Burkholderiales bacterium]